MTPIDSVLGQLNKVKKTGDGKSFMAICPAHDDNDPSLSIGVASDGKVLLKCHAGCDFDEVRTALGLTKAQLSNRSDEREITYDYRDSNGKLVYQVVRNEKLQGKTFRQRRPGKHGDWAWNMKGVKKIPYRLPELLEADKSVPVFITEGEKDSDRLRGLGLVATTNSGGGGKFTPDLAEWFQGRVVVVLTDNDEVGRKHGEKVAAILDGIAVNTKVISFPELPKGGDVSDWLNDGHGIDELHTLVESTREWRAYNPNLIKVTRFSDIKHEELNWLWADRIPQGKITIIAGYPGVGKSFLTLDIAARVSRGSYWSDGGKAPLGKVLLYTAEDGLADTVKPRLSALGADTSRIMAIPSLIKSEASTMSFSLDSHLEMLEETIIANEINLCVIDPLLISMGQGDMYKAHHVRRVLGPVHSTAERTGCTFVGVMHLNRQSNVNPLDKINSSGDFAAAARSVFLVGENPEDPSRRAFASVKSNLSAPAATLGFDIRDGVFKWEPEPLNLTAKQLLGNTSDGFPAPALEEAVEFLEECLLKGPKQVAAIREEAEEQGIKWRTVQRAKRELGIDSGKVSLGNEGKGYWEWALPCKNVGILADSNGLNSEISAYSIEPGKVANQDVDNPKQGSFSGL